MAYDKQEWRNGQSGGTPTSAARFGHMEDGIEAAAKTADEAKAAADNKVDQSSTATKVYGTNSSGGQNLITYASGPTANSLAYRGAGGALQVGDATADNHAVSKKQFDELAARVAAIETPAEG